LQVARGSKTIADAEIAEMEQRNARIVAGILARGAAYRSDIEETRALAAADSNRDEELAQIQLDRARQGRNLSLADEKKYLNQLYEIRRAALQRELEYLEQNDPNNVVRKRQINNQLLVEERRYHAQVEALERSHVGRMRQLIDGLNNSLAFGFQSAIDGMIRGTQTLGQAFSEMALGMLNTIVGVLANMLAQWITTHIIMRIFGQTTAQANATGQIAAASAIAGANGVASFALAPWPIDMGAPAFGASMSAAAMAFNVLKFAKGGMVPGAGAGDTVPALLTPGEYVVPRQLGGFAASLFGDGSSKGAGRLGRSTPVIINNNVNAVDRNSFAKMLRLNRGNMAREFKRLSRNGAFRFAH
jgi:hypothetical protein